MAEKGKWVRIPRGEVCLVCGSKDWCGISADGEVVRCMRIESGRPSPARDGSIGWLHDVDPSKKAIARSRPVAQPVAKIENVPALAMQMARQIGATRKREELAVLLGVSVLALEEMFVGVGWGPDDRMREFASFPSRDGEGEIVGITRRFADGKKLTYPGTSNAGVFCCSRWWLKMGPVFVVEGPTDTLAMHTANLAAVGRASNVAGAPALVKLFERLGLQGRVVTVVCDDDQKSDEEIAAKNPQPHPDDCEGCTRCWPGEFGARAVQLQLTQAGYGVEYVRPIEGYKDVRQMWQAGVLWQWLDAINVAHRVGYDHEAWHRSVVHGRPQHDRAGISEAAVQV